MKRPSWPSLLRPKEQTSPASVTSSVWLAPAAHRVKRGVRPPPRASTRTGATLHGAATPSAPRRLDPAWQRKKGGGE